MGLIRFKGYIRERKGVSTTYQAKPPYLDICVWLTMPLAQDITNRDIRWILGDLNATIIGDETFYMNFVE